MRGRNHCPIENFSIVFADLDDEVPAGTIEIFILGGEAKREGGVVARCLYLAVIEYLVVLIAPYLDAATLITPSVPFALLSALVPL